MLAKFIKELSFRFRLFLTFLTFGIFMLLIAYYTIKMVDNTKSNEIYTKLTSEMLVQKQRQFSKFIDDYSRSKLFFLKEEFINQHMSNRSNYLILSRIFKAVIDSDINIMQLRYIDLNGNEIVRVEKKAHYSKGIITKNNDLQNKKHRNYFLKTMQLDSNKIWYSNINVNIERNKIEVPLKPVLRIGTPIFIENKKVGIVVINLFMNDFLKRFIHEDNFDIFIVDKEGIYISHLDEEKNLSKYKNKKYNMIDDLTELNSNFSSINDPNLIHSSFLNHLNNEKMILVIKPKINSFKEFSLNNKNTLIILFILILLISIPSAHFMSYIPTKLYLIVKEKEKEIEIIMKDLLITRENLHIQDNLIITTNGQSIDSCNKAFLDFFNLKELNDFLFKFSSIKELFIKTEGYFYFDETVQKNHTWVSYIYEYLNGKCTVNMSDIEKKENHIFKVSVNKLESKQGFYVVSFHDVTDIATQTNKLKKIVNYDSLTQIYNRKYFDEALQKNLFKVKENITQNISIIMFDIDNFKLINDTYGHNIGDLVIKAIAKISKSAIRKDDIIARWGGEEFVIILKDANQHIAIKIAEKIRNEIYHTNFDNIDTVTCSFGIHQFNFNDTEQSILESVDKNLYQAKKSGKNRVCHS